MVQFPLNDRRDLPDLQRRQSQPNAVQRVNRIARIADESFEGGNVPPF